MSADAVRASYSWDVLVPDPRVAGWRVYASVARDTKGVLVAEVGADERSAQWDAEDGVYFVRVLWALTTGVEQPWDSIDVDVTEIRVDRLEEAAPEVPPAADVVAVEPSLNARVSIDPPAPVVGTQDAPAYLQVIEGPDADTGKVIAEVPILEAQQFGSDAGRQVSVPFPLEGADEDKTVTVRPVTAAGKPSSDTQAFTVRTPPMDAFHAVVLATVSGATHTGFPVPASTDGHEYDATDGLRVRSFMDYTALDSTFGTILSGIFADAPLGAFYPTSVKVESDELDVGAVCTFRLSIKDTFRRKSAAGALGTVPWHGLAVFPADPIRTPMLQGAPPSPMWLLRETMTDGVPRHPLRNCRWEYVVGNSSSVAHTDADYRPYTPNAWIRGRYVRVRAVLVEPIGAHQVICPSASVQALIPRAATVGAGTPEGVVTRPPGHLYHDTTSGSVWSKQTGVGSTGWVQQATKAQLDAATLGMDWKGSVRVATAAALPSNTRSSNTLTASSNGALTVDGVAVAVGDRILVKDEGTGANNGLYLVTDAGSAGTPFVLVRTTDADASAEVTSGMACAVTEGTANGDTIWVLTTNDTITLNTTALTFAQVGGGGAPSAHATSHQNGGSDEISVAGLSGELADVQPPKIDGLTSETTVDRDADYVPMYDASASANRKVAVRDLASGAIARDSTHVDVGPSSAAETSIFSATVPAGSLGTDRMLRLAIRGTAYNFSGTSKNFQIRVKFGGTTLLDFLLAKASANVLTILRLDVEVQADGATNAQHVSALFTVPTGSAPATGVAGAVIQAGGYAAVEGVGTIDTTADRTLEVTLQLSASDVNLYADIERGILELI